MLQEFAEKTMNELLGWYGYGHINGRHGNRRQDNDTDDVSRQHDVVMDSGSSSAAGDKSTAALPADQLLSTQRTTLGKTDRSDQFKLIPTSHSHILHASLCCLLAAFGL